jgi:hypothetical protein
MIIGPRRRNTARLLVALVGGLFVGALLTVLVMNFLPDSATRSVLTTAVSASIGPLGLDLVALGFVIGPLTINLNALTIVGILLVALVMRSWL